MTSGFTLRTRKKEKIRHIVVEERKYYTLGWKSINQETEKQQTKINETKSWCFEKINKINKSQARLMSKNKSRHKLPLSGMREVITLCIIQIIKGQLSECYKQLYTKKFENLNEMSRLLERCKLPKPIQEDREPRQT